MHTDSSILPVIIVLIGHLFLGCNLMNPHTCDFSPREPVHECFRLHLSLMLGQCIRVRRIRRIRFVDGEVLELQRAISICETNRIDRGCIADLLDAELAACAKAIESRVDIIAVDLRALEGHKRDVGRRTIASDLSTGLGIAARCITASQPSKAFRVAS
jgi:hypothetical protein